MAAACVLHSEALLIRNRSVPRLSAGLVFDLRHAVYASVQQMSKRYIAANPVEVLAAVTVLCLALWMERNHRRQHNKIGSFVHDVFDGIRVVKAFRREEAEIARYKILTTRK